MTAKKQHDIKPMSDFVKNDNVNEAKASKVIVKRSRISKNKIIWVIPVLLVVIGFGGAFFFYKKYTDIKQNPSSAVAEKNSKETERVVEKIKRAVLVEDQEAPTVARVEDPEVLKKSNAVFYKNAQKNDYLVIYPKRAILYRESNDQIINIAPIIDSTQLQQQRDQAAQQKPTE